ncbi:MAG: site-2 protease family protein [Candidatus Absconditabacteria bacterium]
MIDITNILFLVVILVISIGLHEYAHAYVAYRLGDYTPKGQNRLTVNPFAHIDLLGFLMLFVIGFGRGKAVQVNPMSFKDPAKGLLLTSIAGPITNIILGILGTIILMLYIYIVSPMYLEYGYLQFDIISKFWMYFASINYGLAVFNMMPIPPLDGFTVLNYFNPRLGAFIYANKFVIALLFFSILIFQKTIIIGFIQGVSGFMFSVIYYLLSFLFI